MPDAFSFKPLDVGLPTQRIYFEPYGAPVQEFPIPDVVLPTDTTERFWAMYAKLVELGAIPDRKPTFNDGTS
jgi:hypothetical protein